MIEPTVKIRKKKAVKDQEKTKIAKKQEQINEVIIDDRTKEFGVGEKKLFDILRRKARLKPVHVVKKSSIKYWVTVVTVVVSLLLLYPGDNFSFKDISFSIPLEKNLDKKKSQNLYVQSLALLKKDRSLKGFYEVQKILSEALSYDPYNKDIKSLYLKIWSKLIGHLENDRSLKEYFEYLNTVNLLDSPRYVYSQVKLYFYYEKYFAAIKILEESSFLKLDHEEELKALLVEAYLRGGFFDRAKELFASIQDLNHYDVLKTKVFYYDFFNEEKMLKKSLQESLDLYPNDKFFQLKKCDFFLEKKEILKLEDCLKNTISTKFEGSFFYEAQYLKLKGFLFLLKGNLREGEKNLSESLRIRKDDDLYKRVLSFKASKKEEKSLFDLILVAKKQTLFMRINEALEKKDFYLATNLLLDFDKIGEEKYVTFFESRILLEQGFFDLATQKIEELYIKNKKDEETLEIYLETLLKTKRYKMLLKILAEYKNTLGRENLKITQLEAQASFFLDQLKKSFQLFQSLSEIKFFNEDYLLFQGKILFKRKKFQEAKKILNKALKINPLNKEIYSLYSQIIYEVDGVKEAIGYLLTLSEDLKKSSLLMAQLASFYYKIGDLSSFNYYKKELNEKEEKEEFLYDFLLNESILMSEVDKIKKIIDEMIFLFPKRIELFLLKAKIFYQEKNYEEAKRNLSLLEKKFSYFPEMFLLKAKIYFEENNFEEALKVLDLEEKKNFLQSSIASLRGHIYLKMNQVELSEKSFKKSLELNPTDLEALLGMGEISEIKKDYSWALTIYQKILSLDPSQIEIYKKRGEVYLKMGHKSTAIKDFETYLDLKGKESEAVQKILLELK